MYLYSLNFTAYLWYILQSMDIRHCFNDKIIVACMVLNLYI